MTDCVPTVTGAVATAEPPAPVQVMVNILLVVKLDFVSLPERALVPVQSPEAVQEVALVEDQDKREEPLKATLVGFAVRITVGAGAVHDPDTKTTAEAVPNPPVELLPVTVYVVV